MEYTFKRFKELRPECLTNAMIAEIIGTTENNVQVQLRPNKKLPTWARVFLLMWTRETPIVFIEGLDISSDNIKSVINKNEDFARGAMHMTEQRLNTCGCYIDDTGLFRRGKDKCKLQKNVHKFQ